MRSPIVTAIKIVVVVSILAALGIAGYMAYLRLPAMLNELIAPPSKATAQAGEEVIVTIPRGLTFPGRNNPPGNTGLYRAVLLFKLVAFIRGEQRKIKAGDYA